MSHATSAAEAVPTADDSWLSIVTTAQPSGAKRRWSAEREVRSLLQYIETRPGTDWEIMADFAGKAVATFRKNDPLVLNDNNDTLSMYLLELYTRYKKGDPRFKMVKRIRDYPGDPDDPDAKRQWSARMQIGTLLQYVHTQSVSDWDKTARVAGEAVVDIVRKNDPVRVTDDNGTSSAYLLELYTRYKETIETLNNTNVGDSCLLTDTDSVGAAASKTAQPSLEDIRRAQDRVLAVVDGQAADKLTNWNEVVKVASNDLRTSRMNDAQEWKLLGDPEYLLHLSQGYYPPGW